MFCHTPRLSASDLGIVKFHPLRVIPPFRAKRGTFRFGPITTHPYPSVPLSGPFLGKIPVVPVGSSEIAGNTLVSVWCGILLGSGRRKGVVGQIPFVARTAFAKR